ncbi:MAG TPA: hypothetical protein ENJ06_03485 [Phycisphaeraceae bacterium]|nr:hypothetical protein [Phycisphaeraceae bacterium]
MSKRTLVVILVLLAELISLRAVNAKPANPGDWLAFPQCQHRSTFNGKPYKEPVYAGTNGDKILYFIRDHGRNICIEATTGFIGYTPDRDIVVKDKGILVDPASVPPAAEDLTLNVKKTVKGFLLTVHEDKNTWVCDVPRPVDPYEELLRMPRQKGKIGPLHRAIFQRFHDQFENMEAQADKEGGKDPTDWRGGKTQQLPAFVQKAHEDFQGILREIMMGADETVINKPHPDNPIMPGKMYWYLPYSRAGLVANMQGEWIAAGWADQSTGEMLAMSDGVGSLDRKTRGEMITWLEETWDADRTGTLSVRATFMETLASGFTYDPVSQGVSGKYAANTGYIWIGARNERTGEDIWDNVEIGRSPAPYIEARPLKNFKVNGLSVKYGDEVTILVGLCSYSSGKYGGTAHGEISARVHEILAEIK